MTPLKDEHGAKLGAARDWAQFSATTPEVVEGRHINKAIAGRRIVLLMGVEASSSHCGSSVNLCHCLIEGQIFDTDKHFFMVIEGDFLLFAHRVPNEMITEDFTSIGLGTNCCINSCGKLLW